MNVIAVYNELKLRCPTLGGGRVSGKRLTEKVLLV